jgi:hypothetical protein
VIVTLERPVSTWSLVQPGDLVVAIDGYDLDGDPHVVEEVTDYGLRMAAPAGATERRLYRNSHESVTVQRDEPYRLSPRDLAALRRNPKYPQLLESLLNGPRPAGDRGEGVSMASMSHVYGYGWTERGPRIQGRSSWQITERGRDALAAFKRYQRQRP